MTHVLHRWITFNVDKDNALVLSSREEASALGIWDDVHDEAFVVQHLLSEVVFTGGAIQRVHLVGKINRARH